MIAIGSETFESFKTSKSVGTVNITDPNNCNTPINSGSTAFIATPVIKTYSEIIPSLLS